MKTNRITIALLTFLVIVLAALTVYSGNYTYLKELITNALGITAIITVFTIIFGTIFGNMLCVIRSSADKIFSIPSKLFILILQILTILAILFAMYYIIVVHMNWNPVIVAIIAFSINFAVYSSGIFKMGLDNADKGQIEAAKASGFNNIQVFKLIMFPQALNYVLPVYRNFSIDIFKIISIVGYIAILDWGKINSIIKGRIYHEFFTVILITTVYILIVFILTELLKYCLAKLNLKCKKKTFENAEVKNYADN